jgi:hypothetical protein
MEQGEVALCCRSQYQFRLGHTIPNILYILITSVGIPTEPSALAAQPIHHPSYKVDIFFIIHTSNGRGSSFMLQVPISDPSFGSYHSKNTVLLDNFSRHPTEPSAIIITRTNAMLQHLLALYNKLH